jgi:hypothetical protein
MALVFHSAKSRINRLTTLNYVSSPYVFRSVSTLSTTNQKMVKHCVVDVVVAVVVVVVVVVVFRLGVKLQPNHPRLYRRALVSKTDSSTTKEADSRATKNQAYILHVP